MNTFLFCMIFLQVGIFLIAGFCMARAFLTGYGQPVEDRPAPTAPAFLSRRIILTPTELEYFRSRETADTLQTE